VSGLFAPKAHQQLRSRRICWRTMTGLLLPLRHVECKTSELVGSKGGQTTWRAPLGVTTKAYAAGSVTASVERELSRDINTRRATCGNGDAVSRFKYMPYAMINCLRLSPNHTLVLTDVRSMWSRLPLKSVTARAAGSPRAWVLCAGASIHPFKQRQSRRRRRFSQGQQVQKQRVYNQHESEVRWFLSYYSLALTALTTFSAGDSTGAAARTTPSWVHTAISLPAWVYHCCAVVTKIPECKPRTLTRPTEIPRPFAAAGA